MGDNDSYNTALVLQDPGSGTNDIMIISPDPVSSSYTITLPANVGNSGQILKTVNTSGKLGWSDESSASQIIHYNFGGDLNNIGTGSSNYNKNFSMYLGRATEGDLAASSRKTRAPVGYDGYIVKVSYTMQDTSSIGITMRLYVNADESGGVITYDERVDFTIPTNRTGVVSITPFAVSVGDYIQIQYRNGAAGGTNDDPDDSSWIVYQEVS